MEYTYRRETKIVSLNNPKHPELLVYSRMMDRLAKLHKTGKCEYESMGTNWARYSIRKKDGSVKGVHISDVVTFPNDDDIKYTVTICFYQLD